MWNLAERRCVLVEIPYPATNETVPADAVFAVYAGGVNVGDPGRVITLDREHYSNLLSEVRARIEVGDVRRIYQHYEERNLLLTPSGAYSVRLPVEFDMIPLSVGDKVLIQGRSNDAGGLVYISRGTGTEAISDSQAFVDGFAAVVISEAATAYSVVTAGNLDGRLLWDVQSLHRLRGTNELGEGVIKLDLLVTPDLENFPPAYSDDRVYSAGDRFYFENAVYRTLRPVIGHRPPNETYYEKLIDASGGINAALVEDFAKTNFPDADVPDEKLPLITVGQTGQHVTIGYQGQSRTRQSIPAATQDRPGTLSTADKTKLDNLPLLGSDSSVLPKNRLPSDIAYGDFMLAGLWNSGTQYARGRVAWTDEAAHGGIRFWIARRSNSNISPLSTGQDAWFEVAEEVRINLSDEGRLYFDTSRGRAYADNNPLTFQGAWADGTVYYKGNAARDTHNSATSLWVAKLQHTANSGNRPITGVHFSTFWDRMI